MRTRPLPEGARIVVRAPNWVGDIAMATPMLDALCRAEHLSDVRILMRRHLAPLLRDTPLEDRVEGFSGSAEEVAAYKRLRPDGAVILSNSLGSALRALRAGVPRRYGSALSARKLLLTHAAVPPVRAGRRLPIPTPHIMRDVTALLGVFPRDLHPHLAVRDELVDSVRDEFAAAGLGPEEPYVLCCPGAAFGSAKSLPTEFAAVALDALHERLGLRAVVGGGPGEEPLMEQVVSACSHPALSLAELPRDLERLKAQVAGAKLLFVGDSGPRFVAAAFDVPCVCIMGPTFPELTAGSSALCHVLRVEGLECSPCVRPTCPLEHGRCMREIEPERVIRAACELLGVQA